MTFFIYSQIQIKNSWRINTQYFIFTTVVISFELVCYPCPWHYKIEIEETVYGGGLFEDTMYRGGSNKELLLRPLSSSDCWSDSDSGFKIMAPSTILSENNSLQHFPKYIRPLTFFEKYSFYSFQNEIIFNLSTNFAKKLI